MLISFYLIKHKNHKSPAQKNTTWLHCLDFCYCEDFIQWQHTRTIVITMTTALSSASTVVCWKVVCWQKFLKKKWFLWLWLIYLKSKQHKTYPVSFWFLFTFYFKPGETYILKFVFGLFLSDRWSTHSVRLFGVFLIPMRCEDPKPNSPHIVNTPWPIYTNFDSHMMCLSVSQTSISVTNLFALYLFS